jgi:uncharacterized protein with HEPN domain
MRNELIVQKIIGNAEEIFGFSATTLTFEEFESDKKTVAACAMNLLQIGELANKLDDTYMREHKDIPWRKIISVRNRIAHDYEGIDFGIVWEIVKDDLPVLLESLKRLL